MTKHATKLLIAAGLACVLVGCASTAVVTLVPHGPGDIGKGEAEQNGAMFVDLNGKRYEGEFSSMRDSSSTTTGSAFGSAYGSGGYGTATATGTAFSQSNTGNGTAWLRSVDGDMIRCQFRFENKGLGGTAIGVCQDDIGQQFDLTMKVG
ncbi:MAG: hypothetical protein NXH70_08295 [Hyphomonas sp.]|nr:hypothetical protein [Hyphomonas sp.]